MKQDEYSTANQLWNAGSTEVQQLLNPGGPDRWVPTRWAPSSFKVNVDMLQMFTKISLKKIHNDYEYSFNST